MTATGVTILKPLHGVEPGLFENLVSFCTQDYPGPVQIVFGLQDPRDEAIEAPQRRIVNGREIYVGTGPGVSTAAFQDRGLGYVVTSDLDEDSLVRLVPALFNR